MNSCRSAVHTEMLQLFSQLSQRLEKQAIPLLKTFSVRNTFWTILLVCFHTFFFLFFFGMNRFIYVLFILTFFRYISETLCGPNWWNYNGRSKYLSKVVILLHKYTSRWCCLFWLSRIWHWSPEAMWASLSLCLQNKKKWMEDKVSCFI